LTKVTDPAELTKVRVKAPLTPLGSSFVVMESVQISAPVTVTFGCTVTWISGVSASVLSMQGVQIQQ
jgi:hypothetical protein